MDISLITALIYSNTCIYIDEICLEGFLSQHYDIGISSCFMQYVEKGTLKRSCHRIRTRAYSKCLRQLSLGENVLYTHVKVY